MPYWTLGSSCTQPHFMATVFEHTFYTCHSLHQGPILQLIYVPIKQYTCNFFMAVLALGQTGKRSSADSDRGDSSGETYSFSLLGFGN